MSSPVLNIIPSIADFARNSSKPIFLQIAEKISKAILNNQLQNKTKLPGTRQLSEVLGIHRKTAVAVYDELISLGLAESIANKGTFVKNEISNIPQTKSFQKLNKAEKTSGFSFKKSNLLDNPLEFSDCEYVFNDGIPDARLFRPNILSQYYGSTLKRKPTQKKIGNYNAEGSEFFKHHFTSYLNDTRGLNLHKNQLLITRSTEMTVFILSEILLSAGDIVVVGNPGYFMVNMIFQKSGAFIKTIPVDKDGIDVDALETLCKTNKIRMLYVTSRFHYPTTVSLSKTRRKKLLELSYHYDFIIIEDDYDNDFQYEKGEFLPLATEDFSGMVVYIGSFGKSLAPGFRTGFAVSTPEFISEMKKFLGIIDKQGDIVMEQALGEMIAEGEIDRHLRKSLQIYRSRRDDFAAQIQEILGENILFSKPKGGTAFWLEWQKPVNLFQISNRCKEKGLFIPQTLLYQNKNLCAMRIGFANFNNEEARKALEIFSSCF